MLTWRVHLLARRPRDLALVLTTALLAALLARVAAGPGLAPAAGATLILLAAREYLLPIRYGITERGVVATAPLSRMELQWKDVRRTVWRREGLLVSPLPAPSRLDSFRGVYLRFAPAGQPGDEASVRAALSHCGAAVTNGQVLRIAEPCL